MAPLKITRRALVAGTGLIATAVSLRPAMAQPAGFRVIRARAVPDIDESAGPNWRYDGILPGPVLRVQQGEEVMVRLANELSVPTAVHWHGVRLANAMDGTSVTQDPIGSGASFDYRFTPPTRALPSMRSHPWTSRSRPTNGCDCGCSTPRRNVSSARASIITR
jgi:FtsP/CotA-like multicopper oxidase with cupredoxin domain